MTVMVTTRIPGLPAEAYDEIASGMEGALRAAQGFMAHAGAADPDGVTVTELWEEEADWRRFFAASVEPNLPSGLPTPEVVEVRKALLA
jgi:hypothetical protein